jgi:hypothetical protein
MTDSTARRSGRGIEDLLHFERHEPGGHAGAAGPAIRSKRKTLAKLSITLRFPESGLVRSRGPGST